MAVLDAIETDLFFCLRPEQPDQTKWWQFHDASSGSEFLLESRQLPAGKLEVRLTGKGHELINLFRVEQVDHPPRNPENRPWRYTWLSTRRDTETLTWGNGLVIPEIWDPAHGEARVSAVSHETTSATGNRAKMTIEYVASGTPGTLNAMMTLRQTISDNSSGVVLLKFNEIEFLPGGLHQVKGQIFGVTYVLTLKQAGVKSSSPS